jgi:hypothetical protein
MNWFHAAPTMVNDYPSAAPLVATDVDVGQHDGLQVHDRHRQAACCA